LDDKIKVLDWAVFMNIADGLFRLNDIVCEKRGGKSAPLYNYLPVLMTINL